jgi:nucleoside-diphosphate-sugar epimerase
MQLPWERLTADLPDTDQPLFNIGSCVDQTIQELAESIAAMVGYTGTLLWDASMPDGVARQTAGCVPDAAHGVAGFHGASGGAAPHL